jgi:hypothetical protein
MSSNQNQNTAAETTAVDEGAQFSHTLIVPIQKDGGGTISTLTFDEPTIDDMILAEETSTGTNAHVVATLSRSCGITQGDFRKIKARDYNVILRKAGPWLGNG